ncbi:DUF3810 domain-containing protein [Flavobacteriaceae bacterium]|nr:DUF3810 domain-containing protein [Flavobacteriaceae bacterium]
MKFLSILFRLKSFLLCVLVLLSFQFIIRHPHIIESYYSNLVYKNISYYTILFFNKFQFSFGDFLYIFIPIVFFFRLKSTNTRRKNLKICSQFLFGIYVIFNIQWGLNYHRIPLQEKLTLKNNYNLNQLKKTTLFFVNKTNKIHEKITGNDSISVKFDNDLILESLLSIKNSSYNKNQKLNPTIKKSLFSLPLSYMGFSGYINPFTIEAHFNTNISKLNIPTTICHEIAHQLGYSAENEANYISIEATLNSKNVYVNYSGSTFALKYLLNEMYLNDKKAYDELIKKVNTGVLKNYREASDEWKKYKNPLEKYFKKSYDIYLKANNQTKGIKTYNLVVDLLVSKYTNQEF